jgi:N-acetylglutamate synthase-like GNAT family acetyltransferase
MMIRPATLDDAAQVCNVLRRSITELCYLDHGGDESYLAQWLSNKTVENVRTWIQNWHFLVAEQAGTILGAAAMNDSGQITLNYVSPDARFRGVSKALLRGLEENAKAAGLAACNVESSKTALCFYEKAGYVSTRESPIHPLTGTPATILSKRL